jgi:hypothetical protein
MTAESSDEFVSNSTFVSISIPKCNYSKTTLARYESNLVDILHFCFMVIVVFITEA